MRWFQKKSRPSAGFTLVEMLIALAIFSVASASVYFNFHTGLLLYARTLKQGRELQDVRLCLARMESDFQNAVVYDDLPFTGEKSRVTLASVTENFDHWKRSRQPMELHYTFAGDKLSRSSKTLSADYLQEKDEVEGWILRGLENFSFEYGYLGPDGTLIWRDEWARDTDGKADLEATELPQWMRVSFILKDPKTAKENNNKARKKTPEDEPKPQVILKIFELPHGGVKELVVG